MPAVAILGLIGYHNERKDKDFLLLQTKDAIALFRVEYLLIGFPFILIECLRSRFPEAGAMIVTSLLLPKLKAIKWKSIAFPLPFLYKVIAVDNGAINTDIMSVASGKLEKYIQQADGLTLEIERNGKIQMFDIAKERKPTQ